MRSPLSRSLGLIVIAAAGFMGCQILVGIDPADIGGSGGGSTTSTSSSGGGSSTGGSAGGTPCLHPIDCPGADGACRMRTCEAGRCGVADAPAGAAVSDGQVPADCRKRTCDGMGNVILANDDTDVLDDGNPCTTDGCMDGTPHHTPVKAGEACGAGRVCDGQGSCVACVGSAQCGGLLCVNNACVPASCANLVKDGSETAADCGGIDCLPCADGRACLVAADCASGVCAGDPLSCAAPTCADGVKNGDETDVDCGGSCGACAAGSTCKAGTDCAGGACSGSVCLPVCNDGTKNGSETGVDCGGACPACPIGEGCTFDVDCGEGFCQAGRCVPATCGDGVKGSLESDVDCGGICAPCAPGKGCATGADCASGVCAGTLCAQP